MESRSLGGRRPDGEVRPHGVVIDPITVRERRGSAIRFESSHWADAVLLGSVKPLDSVVGNLRPDAGNQPVWIRVSLRTAHLSELFADGEGISLHPVGQDLVGARWRGPPRGLLLGGGGGRRSWSPCVGKA